MSDPFEMSDGAYVLGSLSGPDRSAFEAHLTSCAACTDRVQQLRTLPDILAVAPVSAFGDRDVGGEATSRDSIPATLLPQLLDRTKRERTRRRLLSFTSLAVAAACLITAITVLVSHSNPDPYQPPSQAKAMTNVINVPINAAAQVVTKNSWAQVNIWCTYGGQAYAVGDYQALARTKTGQVVPIGRWPGVPGQTAIMRVPTRLHTADLAAIEIASASGQVVSTVSV